MDVAWLRGSETLSSTQPHISKSLFSDTLRQETTTVLLQFDKYCCISEYMIRGWGMHGDYHRWGGGGSQSTRRKHREALSIHLDRTSKSSNISFGSWNWSLSRARLTGSNCCCRGSRSYAECLALTTRCCSDPHKATANTLFPFTRRGYFHVKKK